jgi:hypothetical protein
MNYILTSFLYQNAFLVIPLLLRASDNSFCSDAVWILAQMFAYDTSPHIILLELLLIPKLILTPFLYQNAFLATPLLLRVSNNSFRSDSFFLALMLFMLLVRCPKYSCWS